MNSGKVVVGVLVGAAVGAALGILFAPDKGSVTRKKITSKGEDLADEMGAKFNQFMETISKQFETVKQEAKESAEKMKQSAEEFKV
ncbi:MAG: YtxH domain-containing protein [Flavobacteriales bacterium]